MTDVDSKGLYAWTYRVPMVADEHTPEELRRYAGRRVPIGAFTKDGTRYGLPKGEAGIVDGVPGVLVELDREVDPLVWLIRAPVPAEPWIVDEKPLRPGARPEGEPPAWAAELGRKLDQIIDKLEAR